jgi:hypothetical protein
MASHTVLLPQGAARAACTAADCQRGLPLLQVPSNMSEPALPGGLCGAANFSEVYEGGWGWAAAKCSLQVRLRSSLLAAHTG